MNILGIVPARAGSKRLENKNLKLIGGVPLYKRVMDAALKSTYLNSIAVTTDDKEILGYSSSFKNVTTIHRPEALCTDDSPAIEYVKHVLATVKDKFDAVVIIQPSSPLTLPEDIDNTIELLIDSNADTAVSVMKLSHSVNPLKMKIMQDDKLLPFLEEENGRMAYNEVPEIYVRNCAVYASKIETIKSGAIIGKDCRGYIMPAERSVDINDDFDLAFAEFLYERKAGKNKN